jgi:sugar phosphate isomerase/epimerase
LQLSAITDEISADLDMALRVCDSLGVGTIELRSVDGCNLVHHDPATLRRVRSAIRGGGFRCTVIDTPFLKEAAVGAPVTEDEWAAFRRGLSAAAELGATTVRVFAGARQDPPNGSIAWAADVLAEAVELAGQAGVRVALEIEFACAVATGLEAAALLRALGAGPGANGALGAGSGATGDLNARSGDTSDSRLGIVWDPGNEARFAGTAPSREGYQAVRDRIVHVHVKDVDASGRWTRVGDGIADWRGELRRLSADGYDGLLSLETHYSLPSGGAVAATRECAAALRELAEREGIAL